MEIWKKMTDRSSDVRIHISRCRVQNEGHMQNSFYVKNTPSYTMDTYYGYGYSDRLLMDEQVDLSTLHPVFWNASDMEVHSGEEQIVEYPKKFLDGPVQYVGTQ